MLLNRLRTRHINTRKKPNYFLSKCLKYIENKHNQRKEKYLAETFSAIGGTSDTKLEVGFTPSHLFHLEFVHLYRQLLSYVNHMCTFSICFTSSV